MEKLLWRFGTILVLLILGLPIISNFLMHLSFRDTAVQGNDWIGFFGSYMGGIVSGGLTLLGVILTIILTRKNDYIDSLSQKMMNIEDIISQLKFQKYLLDDNSTKFTGSKLSGVTLTQIRDMLKNFETEGLLRKATLVNANTYRATREFYNYIKGTSQYLEGTFEDYEALVKNLNGCLNKLMVESEKINNNIDEIASKYDS